MGMMTIMTQCPFCGAVNEIEVDFNAYMDYKTGVSAQRAFYKLSPTDREKIISGMCDKCQAEIFA